MKVGYPYRLIFISLLLCFALLPMHTTFGRRQNHSRKTAVRGMSFFENRRLNRSLAVLDESEDPQQIFDRQYIEDAIWVLDGSVKALGYPHPTFAIVAVDAKHRFYSFTWDGTFTPEIPADISSNHLYITVHRGILNYYDKVILEGLPQIKDQNWHSFFCRQDVLFCSNSDDYYTEDHFHHSINDLIRTLHKIGYREAKVDKQTVQINETTGAVQAEVVFSPGPKYYVGQTSIALPTTLDIQTLDIQPPEQLPEQPLTYDWLNQATNKLRSQLYKKGYPDTKVTTTINAHTTASDNQIVADVKFDITPGPQVRVGKVAYQGMENTNPNLLKQKTTIQPGELLDVETVQQSRDNLAQLGIFETLIVDYDKTDPHIWNVNYNGKLKPPNIVKLIFGFGSYEILRLGAEITQNNLWNRAHSGQLRAVKSFRSTEANYLYKIPTTLGENVKLFSNLSYLNRDEIAFTRREIGGSLGLETFLKHYGTYATVQYNYSRLDARNDHFSSSDGLDRATASSVQFSLQKNKLDSPLYPENGYKLYATTEFALTFLGGNVQYQRVELGSAYHLPLNNTLILHTALRHGFITSTHSMHDNIPVNKRFFPGGPNTVRGYRLDQASPKNSEGDAIGAETYTLGNLELEQRLTDLLSLVAFVDAVGFAKDIEKYPFNKALVSIGGGLSIHSPMGPIRFEYGQNVNPRPNDPQGTFLVALGFPF